MDINAVRKRLAQLQTTNTRTTNLWKPQPGKTQIRIVPYKLQKDTPFIELFFHYDLGGKSYLSPTSFGRPDPIEEFADNCRFIITCNYKNRIISPIHSRCTNIEFAIPSEEKPSLAGQFMQRVKTILDKEAIPYEDKILAQLITKYFPDFRRVLNELQRYSVAGIIDIGILSQIGEVQVKELAVAMKGKNFTEARKWVVSNLDNSQTELFRKIYDGLHDYVTPSSIPQAILILADYQHKAAFVADQEINLTACIVELMMECEFK